MFGERFEGGGDKGRARERLFEVVAGRPHSVADEAPVLGDLGDERIST